MESYFYGLFADDTWIVKKFDSFEEAKDELRKYVFALHWTADLPEKWQDVNDAQIRNFFGRYPDREYFIQRAESVVIR